MTKSLQVLQPKFRTKEILSEIEDCLENCWSGMGYKTEVFEEKWNSYTGHANSIFVNSATSGLHLALELIKNKTHKKKVITTPVTFVSTNHVILHAGLTPLFVDVDSSLNIDPNDLFKKLDAEVAAVIFVGIGGNTKNFEEIVNICRKNGIFCILDAAHMSGSRQNGTFPGLSADISVYSFQAVKNLPTADAGIVSCESDDDAQFLRKMSWMGINKDTYSRAKQGSYRWDYDVDNVGYKYNGNSIMAAMAIVGLKYLDSDNNRRRKILEIYEQNLLQGRLIIHDNKFETSQHLIQIEIDQRDKIIDILSEAGIYCGVHYKNNLQYEKIYSGRLNNAEKLSARIISLPCHLNMTDADVKRVSDVINNIRL
jgi:dTDP-4-amino-4,6-dideoxygalactose transaminase